MVEFGGAMRRGKQAAHQAGWPEDYLRPVALAPATAPSAPPRRQRPPLWLELIETALLTLVLFVLVRMVVLNFKVDGLSMTPTLSHGQYLLVNRVAYLSVDQARLPGWFWPERCIDGSCFLFGPPRRGDIVVFWPPAATERPFIKRIIGLPGERVEVRDGTVRIDGEALDEPYIRGPVTYTAAPVTVPPGHYYVLGDNRNNSSDSHLFGVLPGDQIIGQAWLCYWPPQQFGFLTGPSYPSDAGRGGRGTAPAVAPAA
jgi:signal peptidase I